MKELVKSVRDFNRFYVNLIGILQNNLFDLNYSLTESRIIFEIGTGSEITASKLKNLLFIDEGYLSRLIGTLVKNGMVCKSQSKTDRRVHFLSLTKKGKNLLDEINIKSDKQIEGLLTNLNPKDQSRVAEIMAELKNIFENRRS